MRYPFAHNCKMCLPQVKMHWWTHDRTIIYCTFLVTPVNSNGNFHPPAPSTGLGSPLGRSRHHSSQSDLTGPPINSSGLSFTACMSDFSLYVFHPYGAGKQKSAVTGLPPGPGPLGKSRYQTFCHSKDYLFNNL